MADPPVKTAAHVGDYEVLIAGSPVAFWPLDPEVALSKSRPPIVAAPTAAGGANTVVIPAYGVFDILIRTTDGAVVTTIARPALASAPGGKATLKKAPMVQKTDGSIHIRFATDHTKVASGGAWEGSLRLTATARIGTGKTTPCKTEMKLSVPRLGTVSDLFVFFVAHERPKKNAWIKSRVETAAGAAIDGAEAEVKVLRDNGAFSEVNRRIPLDTEAGDLVGGTARPVLAVPVAWPLIFTLMESDYVTRGHMINVKESETSRDNRSPLDVGPMHLNRTRSSQLTNRKFVLDAGHGVIYALTAARRCQEWYVAHKLADRIAEILHSEHGVKPTDISFSRSAGFGLIEPGQVRTGGAPENGEKKYQLDLPGKKIAIKQATLGLSDLAALLLTKHEGDKDAPVALTAGDHTGFLKRYRSNIDAIVSRLDTKLAATHERVKAGSVHWEDKHYVYQKEKQDKAGVWQPETGTLPVLPLTTSDWFPLDSAALWVLADRSARWSLAAEIGGNDSFRAAARAAMLADGALAYFRDKILHYLDVTAPHPYLSAGAKAWGPTERVKYLNSAGAGADMILTLHENAGGGKGGMVLVSHKSGLDAPPKDQVRIGKTFVKYLDGFDLGVRQGGVATDLEHNPAQMLYHGTTVRAKYAYFESEFMDGKDPDAPTRFTYERMVDGDFVETVARQIVCGVVEWLLDPQASFDPVKYPLGANIQGLW